MIDMSSTIIPKSDQLNSDDLISGPVTIKITSVKKDEGSKEQPILIFFEGDNGKPWKPCKSMRKVLVEVWGKDGLSYVGRRLTLYRDPTVTWGGLAIGGIRVSHMGDIDADRTFALTATKQSRKPYTVKRLIDTIKGFVETIKSPPNPQTEDPMPLARAAASKGKAAFTAWWIGGGKPYRDQVKPNMAELTELAAKADAIPPDDDLPM
jgi:hypothetical protein